MRPSHVIGHEQRRLRRLLTDEEQKVVLAARAKCPGGKRDTVKAMHAALVAHLKARPGTNPN